MSEPFEIPADPALRLAAAGAEWRALVNAEGEIERLDRYRHLTSDMRQDRHRHWQRAQEARIRLHSLLGAE